MSQSFKLPIVGMSCAGCASRLTKKLQTLPNVTEVNVNFATNLAYITGENLNLQDLIANCEQAGFSVPTHQMQLKITGMSCTSCAVRLNRHLQHNQQIVQAEVNFASNTANITSLANYEPLQIIVFIRETGFNASLIEDDNNSHDNSVKKLNWQLINVICALVLALPLMLPMLGLMLPMWVQFGLATLVQFGFGLKFYKNAWFALKSYAGNMDLLVAIGTSCAYGLSVYLWLFTPVVHQHLYFEASAMVVALVLVGKYLESITKTQTGSALADLRKLRPSTAQVVRNNKQQTVPISELCVNDVVYVQAGMSFAADGVIIEGSSNVDESLLSGESSLISKTVGDTVHAGAINNDGALLVKIKALGTDTQLGKIIRLVETAEAQKAPIQKLVDKISYYFVPSVLVIALVTFVVWFMLGANLEQALINAVTVLVIACPCALGLATPAAIMVGVGLAAKYGILLHKPSVLEQSNQISAVVFDKTGTLTQGKPKLSQINAYTINQDQALIWATSLQTASNHPLGKALINACTAQKLEQIPVKNAKLISGAGVMGEIENLTLAVGNQRWLASLGFAIKDDNLQTSSYLVELNPLQQVLAQFSFSDAIKTESVESITSLKNNKIKTYLVSGDKSDAVAQIAQTLAITDFKAEVVPQEKSAFIQQLQQQGFKVAMVGDGVNDAPALAVADIGIAMGSGTDVALKSSDVTLLNNDPRNVATALLISRKTYAKIKQNLFWAFVYNLCGIPLAALGVLNPVLAGLMMAASSVCVISNSLLLKRLKVRF